MKVYKIEVMVLDFEEMGIGAIKGAIESNRHLHIQDS